uniref:Protein MON2 n=1 Tax=Anthurium amnicola TaxID=1678845 RepID=A0A1D1Y1P9_9ARAE
MFYGHYGGAWIIKVLEPKIPLWVLMIAVQFIDFLFVFFVLLDIEEVRVVRGFSKASDLQLISIPYTHSLIAAIGWSILYGLWYRFSGYGGGNLAAFLVGLAVLSHWFEDLLVHTEDLSLTFDDTALKYGFGLWNHPLIYYPLELLFFYGSYFYYLINTEVHPSKLQITRITNTDNTSNHRQYNYQANKWVIIFSIYSLCTYISCEFVPPPENCKLLVIIMLFLYIVMASLANQLDKVRVTKHNNRISDKLKLLNE